MSILWCTLPTTRSYPRFNRLTQICLNLPAFQAMFTPSLTHVLPLWLNFSLLFTLRIPQINDISFENCLFHLIIVSVFTHSWNTRTTSTYTNIIDQNKEIKNAIFVFSPLLRSIEWTDYCTTGNGGKSTAHVVPALIRVCGFSGRSRGGAWRAQPPLIF